jgi:integral membrane protein
MSPTAWSPLGLFRRLALAEAVTWALLLSGMFLKYVTDTTELGVRVFGMAHGVVFIGYCLTTVLVAVDPRWTVRRLALGLAAAVPPFATVLFERYAERRSALGATWRLRDSTGTGPADRVAGWLLRNPLHGTVAGVVAVGALTGVALLVGPPAG